MNVRRAVVLLALAPICVAAAQGVRVSGVTSLQAVDLRPLVADSVPVSEATGTGPYRVLADGTVVRCVTGDPWCRFKRSGTRALAAPALQDLRVVVWGLGQGISAQAHVRARASLGDEFDWPHTEDAFDVIEAWGEFDRPAYRARLGRQWTVGGLGVYNYDGASLMLRSGRARVEVFGGRSLVAGLNDPIVGSELASLNDLPPDESGWLIGVAGASPLGKRGAAGATWQRVIRADRAALYSDRLAANASYLAVGTTFDFDLAWDITALQVNEARLSLSRPFSRAFTASVEGRRYRPFFEAWTIWGAFSPVAFDEARGAVSWRNGTGSVSMDARGAYRWYDETEAGLESSPLKGNGWRAGIGGEWRPRTAWLVYGDYDTDIGFGASKSDVVAGTRWMPDESRWIGAAVSGLQHIYEFRVGTGRMAGFRIEGGARLADEVRIAADAALYAHRRSGGAPSPDWSQRRFSVRLDWTVGRDPGVPPVAGNRP